MSENKKTINEIIEYIESSIREGFEKEDFIREFREKIEIYVKEKIS